MKEYDLNCSNKCTPKGKQISEVKKRSTDDVQMKKGIKRMLKDSPIKKTDSRIKKKKKTQNAKYHIKKFCMDAGVEVTISDDDQFPGKEFHFDPKNGKVSF